MKIMNPFYALWADAIYYQKEKGDAENWKFLTFFYMSFLFCWNIGTLFSIVLFFTGFNLASEIRELLTFSSSKTIVNFTWAILVLFIPAFGINYFFVFYKKKYRNILKNYEFRNGRILLTYFIVSVTALFGFSLLNKFFPS